jgi:hypothetical protein
VTAASDVWGWGACVLGLLGLLGGMRRAGYRAFLRALHPHAPAWSLGPRLRLSGPSPRDRRPGGGDGWAGDVCGHGADARSHGLGPWEQRAGPGPGEPGGGEGGEQGGGAAGWRSGGHAAAWRLLADCLSLRPAARPPLAEAVRRLALHVHATAPPPAAHDGIDCGAAPAGAPGPAARSEHGPGEAGRRSVAAVPATASGGGEGGAGRGGEVAAWTAAGAAGAGYRVCEAVLGPGDEQTWAAGWRLVAALCGRGDAPSLAHAEEVSALQMMLGRHLLL